MAKNLSSIAQNNFSTVQVRSFGDAKIAQAIPAIASLITIFIAGLVLIGWQFDIDWLKQGCVANEVTMKANTAVAFILAGISLNIVSKAESKKEHPSARLSSPLILLSQICGIAVFLIGLLTLIEYLFSWNLGIDELLFRDLAISSQDGYPGRMGDNTALNFLLIGIALWLHHRRSHSKEGLLQWLTLVAGAIAALALVGYFYDVDTFHQFFVYSTSMAWHTAFTFIVLCIGILFVRRDRGLMEPLMSDLSGGKSARQFLPAAIILPTILGWLILQGQKLGGTHPNLSFAILVVSLSIMYFLLIWHGAKVLNRIDRKRQQTEADLQQSQERLKLFAESDLIGLLFGDIYGRVNQTNDAFLKIIGYTREDLVAGRLHWDKITPPEYLPLDEERIAEARVRGLCTPYEKEYIRKDGRRVWVLVGYILLGEEREESVAFILDINDRKRAEAALQESEERYRKLVEYCPDGIFIQSQNKIVFANGAALDFFGAANSEDLLGKTVYDLICPEYTEIIRERIQHLRNGRAVSLIEEKWFRLDGTVVDAEVAAIPFTYQGQSAAQIVIRDISDRKKSETKLRQTLAILNAINENTPTLIYVKDRQSRLLMVNPPVCQVLGKPESEVIGLNDAELYIDRKEAERVMANDRLVMETGQVQVMEETAEFPEGRRVFLSTKSPYRDEKGNIIGIIGVSIDISDRKQTEKALFQSEERLRLATEAAQIGMWFWDLPNNELVLTDKCKALFGFAADTQISYQLFLDSLHPDDRQYTHSAVTRAIEEKIAYDVEYRTIWSDGSVHWIAAKGRGFYDAKGKAVRMMGTAQEISARKKAELERDRYFSLSLDMLGIASLDGYFKQINSACERILGYTPTEFMSQPYIDFVHPDDRDRTIAEAQRLSQGTKTFNFENRYRCKDGSYKWLAWSVVPVVEEGLLYTVAHDITGRKRIEAEIREFNTILEERVKHRTAQLEAANKELESFSYSVSHDLRAPLRHIAGFVELLQKRLKQTEIDAASQRYLDIIVETTRQAGELIDDLLTFSRMGRTEMRYSAIDMNLLVNEVLSDLTPEMHDRVIDWHIDNLPTVKADPSMLRLVWQNLLENALKYTKLCPQTEISVGTRSTSQEVIFFVKDNGIGFDMQYIHKLFGVFQRLHSDPQFEGTGVGLANVQRIIHRHNGRVWADGAVHQGATFYFALPKEMEIRGGEE